MKPLTIAQAKCIKAKYDLIHVLKFETINANMVKFQQLKDQEQYEVIVIFTYKNKLDSSYELEISEFFKTFKPIQPFEFDVSDCMD